MPAGGAFRLPVPGGCWAGEVTVARQGEDQAAVIAARTFFGTDG